jgi:hypothetical protein
MLCPGSHVTTFTGHRGKHLQLIWGLAGTVILELAAAVQLDMQYAYLNRALLPAMLLQLGLRS